MRRQACYVATSFALLFSTAAICGPVTYEYTAVLLQDRSSVATGLITFDDQPLDVSGDTWANVQCGRPNCGAEHINTLLWLTMDINGYEVPFGEVLSSFGRVYVDGPRVPDPGTAVRQWFFGTQAEFSNEIGLSSASINVPEICQMPDCPPTTWAGVLAMDTLVPRVAQGPFPGGVPLGIQLAFDPGNTVPHPIPELNTVYTFQTLHKVPEPSSLALATVAALGLLFRRRRRSR
jgi:PEP-CTERM motif